MSDIEKIADEYFAGKMPRPTKILCDSCKGELDTSHNTQKQSASQIAADMAEWAEHLDQYSNESTYCRIHQWKRQLQLL